MERPGVVEIESLHHQFRFVGLGQHHDVRFDLIQLATSVLPKVCGQFGGDVATKTVQIKTRGSST